MIQSNIFTDSAIRKTIATKGPFQVIEYQKDMSVNKESAMMMYYAAQMNVRKRQVIANLDNSGVTIQAGAMQLMLGNVNAQTNVSSAGDLLKKVVGSRVTGETAIKPRYTGVGSIVLEPTYKYVLLEDLSEWEGQMVIEDGLFLACQDGVSLSVVARSNLSSAVLGGEGLFNTVLKGNGVVVLESPVPREELIVVDLKDDVLKIDGNMAIAWSNTLTFTVEKVTKTLVGSAASGEGFVNVYRGTGKVLIAVVK